MEMSYRPDGITVSLIPVHIYLLKPLQLIWRFHTGHEAKLTPWLGKNDNVSE